MLLRRNVVLIALAVFLITTFALTAHASPSHQQPPDDQWTIIRKNGQLYAINGTLERPLGTSGTDCTWSPKQDWVQVRIAENAYTLSRLSDGYSLTITDYHEQRERIKFPAWSPDGEWLVYEEHSPNGQDTDLYRMDIDGTAPQPIVSLPDSEYMPQISYTGEWIYFVSDAPDYDMLYRVRPDGTSLTRIKRVNGTFRRMVLSPNAEWIYYSVNTTGVPPQSAIHIYNVADELDYFLDESPDGTSFVGFSPDSQWVFYNLIYPPKPNEYALHHWELYAVRVNDRQRQYIVDLLKEDGLRFSPDLQDIFVLAENYDFYRVRLGSDEPATPSTLDEFDQNNFVNFAGYWSVGHYTDSQGKNGFAVYFAPIDGSELRIFPTGAVEAQLSPQQKWFAGIADGKLYRIRTDGAAFDPIYIPSGAGTNVWADVGWSPDEQWITINDASGLYLMPADGTQFERLLSGSPGINWVWTSDSQRIFAQNDAALYAFSVDGADPTIIEDGGGYFFKISPDYQWAAIDDGQRMINLNTHEVWNIPNPDDSVIREEQFWHETIRAKRVTNWSVQQASFWSVDSQIFALAYTLRGDFIVDPHIDGVEEYPTSGSVSTVYYLIYPAEKRISDVLYEFPQSEFPPSYNIFECARP